MQLNLEQLFAELRAQHFEPGLPLPKLEWNSRMSSCAGRFSPGSWYLRDPKIEIASYLRERGDGSHHVRDTMLHEMIHYYLWWKGRPYGHTDEFYAIMKRTGASRFNPVPKVRPVKHWYQCPSCLVQVPARRKLGVVACLACCKKYNGGHFSREYILTMVSGRAFTAEPVQVAEEEAFLEPHVLIQRLQDLQALVRNVTIRKD